MITIFRSLKNQCKSTFNGWKSKFHTDNVFCYICQETDTDDASFTELKCKHTVHKECLYRQLGQLMNSERGDILSLGIIQCGICKTWIKARCLTLAQKDAIENFKQFHFHCERVKNNYVRPESDPHRLYYFRCYICYKLSNGAMTDCNDQSNVHERNLADNLCFNCQSKCPFHESSYLVYKCRFCCDVATWDCTQIGKLCNDCHLFRAFYAKPCICNNEHFPNGSLFPVVLSCAACTSSNYV